MAKTLHYNFLTNPTLTGSEHPIATSPDLSITRATKATMVDADGYIREVQAGEARFTGATWRNNYGGNSNNFADTGYWVGFGGRVSITSGQADPFGGTDAGLMNENGSLATSFVMSWSDSTNGLNVKDNTAVVASIYIKKFARWGVRFSYFTNANAENRIDVDLTDTPGTIGTVSGFSGSESYGIESIGDGWYRVYIYLPDTGIGTNEKLRVTSLEADNDISMDGLNGGAYYIYGAMVEDVAGKSQTTPGTYIDTGTTDAGASELTGTSTKGLLVEEARTQLLASTEAFSASPWFTSAAAIDNNAATSPSGATDADRFKDNSAGGSGNPRILQSLTVSASTEYVYSVFAKADGESWIRLFVANMGALVPSAYFNLSAGTIGTTSADVDDATIEDYGNGWYRVSIAFTSDATDTSITAYMGVADGDGDDTVALDGTSSVFIWGAMFEAGSGYPSSYISNTATSGTVTRNADQVSTTDMSWWNDVEGTIYCEASLNGVFQSPSATGQNYIYSIDDGTENNRVIQWINQGALPTAGSAIVRVASGGTTQAQPTDARSSGVYAVGTATKTALGIKENDFAFYLDGSEAALGSPDTSGSMPAVSPTKLNIGQRLTANFQTGGHIAEIAYFNERLANATLEDYSLNGLPTAFPGTVAGDGGHIWPARSNDPRWAQIITDSGITPSGNFIDDVHAALEAMASTTGAMDDLWKKVKAVYSITDTSEPFTY